VLKDARARWKKKLRGGKGRLVQSKAAPQKKKQVPAFRKRGEAQTASKKERWGQQSHGEKTGRRGRRALKKCRPASRGGGRERPEKRRGHGRGRTVGQKGPVGKVGFSWKENSEGRKKNGGRSPKKTPGRRRERKVWGQASKKKTRGKRVLCVRKKERKRYNSKKKKRSES